MDQQAPQAGYPDYGVIYRNVSRGDQQMRLPPDEIASFVNHELFTEVVWPVFDRWLQSIDNLLPLVYPSFFIIKGKFLTD